MQGRKRNITPAFPPTAPYRFCPADGTKLGEPNAEGGVRCPACGRSWYRSSDPATGCAIVRDERVLVAVRAGEPEKGRIDLPGGFLKAGEHPVDGLRREVREELGVEVADVAGPIVMETHTYGPDGKYVLALGFAARLAEGSGEPCPADDVAEVMWVSADELDVLDFAWEHDREIARRALERG